MTLDELSSALAARGLIVDGHLNITAGLGATTSPWYVQVLMGFCAWLAGLFLLLFIVLGLEDLLFHGGDRWGVVLFLGLGACAVAVFLYRVVGEKSTFASQFALAMSLCGQSAMVISMGGVWNPRAALWGMMPLEIVLTLTMRNRLHRMLSSFLAVIAWALATHEILFHEIPGFTWSFAQPERFQISIFSVLLWLVVWAPIAIAAYWLVAGEAQWMARGRDSLLRPVTHGLIAALAIAPLATHPATFWMAMGMGAPVLLTDGSLGATALWPLLAIFLALLALALGFQLRNRPLMGVAIIFALLEVSGFYYVLGTTLLIKSVIMIVLGAALLLSAHLLAKESL